MVSSRIDRVGFAVWLVLGQLGGSYNKVLYILLVSSKIELKIQQNLFLHYFPLAKSNLFKIRVVHFFP